MSKVNNEFYDTLKEHWYNSDDNPIALLRAEQKLKNPWIEKEIKELISRSDLTGIKVLDIGCGGGFLTNYLAQKGAMVVGLDQSKESLSLAAQYDSTKSVTYLYGDAYHLPFENAEFDFVFAMDFLEHVEEPQRVIAQASRVLKTNGAFFYHTFNKNFLAWLMVIKFVEWFLPKTPKNLHILRLFIKPKDLFAMLQKSGLKNKKIYGMGPVFLCREFFWSLIHRRVHPQFRFELKKTQILAYIGYALKS